LRLKRLQRKKRKIFQKLENSRLFYSIIFLSIFVLFLVGGCGGESPPPLLPQKGKASSVEKKMSEPLKVVEKKEIEKKEKAEYIYNPAGKADPFKPFIQLTPIKTSPKSIPQTPLQNYEVSQLKLVAIISTPEGNIALVEDSTGKGYFLKEGTWVGKNDGKVTKILIDRVIIEEIHQDISSPTKKNEIKLFLHRVEEGGES
jgi:type IV pilus assembly protein PilP